MDNILALIGRAHQGDKRARDILTEKNMGLVHSIAARFKNRGVEMEDLVQIGCIGLLKAIDKFDLSYDVKFSTYAVPMITGEIKRFLRDDGMVKVSRSLKEMAAKAYALREQFILEKGREGATDRGTCKRTWECPGRNWCLPWIPRGKWNPCRKLFITKQWE